MSVFDTTTGTDQPRMLPCGSILQSVTSMDQPRMLPCVVAFCNQLPVRISPKCYHVVAFCSLLPVWINPECYHVVAFCNLPLVQTNFFCPTTLPCRSTWSMWPLMEASDIWGRANAVGGKNLHFCNPLVAYGACRNTKL